jgi:hypothetical protein
MSIKKRLTGLVLGAITALSLPAAVFAAETVVVTPSTTQGWSTADTRPGGDVDYVSDADAPAGTGALQLTTDATTTAKAQYMHEANVALADITDLSYYTKQTGASFAGGAPSYQVPVFLNGGTSGFTTLVYEPYQNGTVEPGEWQQWDVDAGKFWSSRSVTCSNGSLTAGGGGEPFYTLAEVVEKCPNAVVAGFGVNIGSNNPSYNVSTDLVSFNGTAYNFELNNVPADREACKNNGYKVLTTSDDKTFKNQGDCVSYMAKQQPQGPPQQQ